MSKDFLAGLLAGLCIGAVLLIIVNRCWNKTVDDLEERWKEMSISMLSVALGVEKSNIKIKKITIPEEDKSE